MVGCRDGGKNSLDKNYLYLAEQLGADIFTEEKVIDIRQTEDDTYELATEKVTDIIFKKKKKYHAKGVILAGGVLGTLDLLMKCKSGGSLPKLLSWGIGAGFAVVMFNLLVFVLAQSFGMFSEQMTLGFYLPDNDACWEHAGNLFSNFYEEIIYRGFILVVTIASIQKKALHWEMDFMSKAKHLWLGLFISGCAFGLSHSQYPFPVQVLLILQGMLAALVLFKTRSIWACWLQHEIIDICMNTLFSAPPVS